MYEDWEQIKQISGNSGCDAFLVKRKGGDGKLFFLKQFTGEDSKKRGRFARETLMYDTLNIDAIPELVEHDITTFKDKKAVLYYVCKHIAGEDLETYQKNNKLSEEQVIDLFQQLLVIIQQVHVQEAVHRDIKPQNIIINDEGKLFLVDFGIAHMDLVDYDFKKTPKSDELGNRFLKLADYLGGADNKRAPQSDLTMCCGIALFLLSGEYPRTLQDDAGKYPHQRAKEMAAINKLKYKFYWNIIFDKAFQHDLLRRWATADEILTILTRMTNQDDKTEEYRKLLQTQAEGLDKNYFKSLSDALKNVQKPLVTALDAFLRTEGEGFDFETQRWVYKNGVEWIRSHTRAYRQPDRTYADFNVWAEKHGGQIIGSIAINDEEKIEMVRVAFGDGLSEADYEILNVQFLTHILPALEELAKK